jgi:hypothetical protein
MRWFSLVTVAYHVYFAAYVSMFLLPESWRAPWAGPVAAVLLLAVGLGLAALPSPGWLALALPVFAVSVAAGTLLWPGHLGEAAAPDGTSVTHLLGVAPVMGLGLVLCPYLDLTFHRALREAPSRHAFAIFGATFALMLVVSCLYWLPGGIDLRPIVLVHLAAQSAFTVGAHVREMRAARTAGGWLVAPLAAAALAYLPALGDDPPAAARDIFVRFLVFYALLFPAYVLLFMGPARPLRRGHRALALFALVVIALAPLYEAGFIGDAPLLLLIPVAAAGAWIAWRGRTGPG